MSPTMRGYVVEEKRRGGEREGSGSTWRKGRIGRKRGRGVAYWREYWKKGDGEGESGTTWRKGRMEEREGEGSGGGGGR